MLNRHLREMTSAIVVVLWLNILIGIRVFGIENGVTCGRGLVMHTNNAGLNRCCLNIACDPGTEARPCEDFRPDSTSCISCGPGKFQSERTESYLLRKCQRHTSCHLGSVVSHHGSATTDVKCTCDLELGYFGTAPDCLTGDKCKPGHQLTDSGACEQCPPNTYRNGSSSSRCSNCVRCGSEMQEIPNSCTAVSDTVCRNTTHGPNPDKVNNLSIEQMLLLIIFGVFLPVIIVLTVIILCLRKCRNGETFAPFRGSISSGSTSNSDPKNLNQQCQDCIGDTQRESEACSSLCESEMVQRNQKSDFDQRWRRSESEGLLNSPLDDISVMDASFDLKDERVPVNVTEDNQCQSVEYVVETESLPSCSQGTTVMKGKCNVQNGNVYILKNCNNIRFEQPK